MNGATQTAKTMLTNVETLDIGRRLRMVLKNSLTFEQALFQSATPATVECLESLIGTAIHLQSEETSPEERAIRKYLRDSVRPIKDSASVTKMKGKRI